MSLIRLIAESASAAGALCRVSLVEWDPSGALVVRDQAGRQFVCDWLESGAAMDLRPGDSLLALEPTALARGVVLGRVGRYVPAQPQLNVAIEATESLTLKCGESSVTLCANGQVMVKGEDVLIRAKGTQRIRAGNVAIN